MRENETRENQTICRMRENETKNYILSKSESNSHKTPPPGQFDMPIPPPG